MIYYKHLIGLVCAAAFILPFAGCGDSDDEGASTSQKELKLVLSESKVQTGEEVAFTVLSGDEEVTAAARIRNVKTDTYLDGPKFASGESGVYRFEAELNGKVSKEVPLKVFGSFEPNEDFYRQVLVQKYTATWCVYCPQMTNALQILETEVPGRIVQMAVHVKDSYSIAEGERLVNDFNIASIPQAVFDYRVTASHQGSKLSQALQEELKDYPAVCGIAAESSVEGDRIYAEAKIRFAETGRYRVCCAVIEDGLQYENGYSEDGYYNHVLRSFATSRTGEALGVCEAGTEYPCAYTFTVAKTWNLQNCSVLFYVMKEEGAALYTNNVVVCPALKGSCEFRYETK